VSTIRQRGHAALWVRTNQPLHRLACANVPVAAHHPPHAFPEAAHRFRGVHTAVDGAAVRDLYRSRGGTVPATNWERSRTSPPTPPCSTATSVRAFRERVGSERCRESGRGVMQHSGCGPTSHCIVSPAQTCPPRPTARPTRSRKPRTGFAACTPLPRARLSGIFTGCRGGAVPCGSVTAPSKSAGDGGLCGDTYSRASLSRHCRDHTLRAAVHVVASETEWRQPRFLFWAAVKACTKAGRNVFANPRLNRYVARAAPRTPARYIQSSS
jgi:hypothetical protein